jgi:hypothetical protein
MDSCRQSFCRVVEVPSLVDLWQGCELLHLSLFYSIWGYSLVTCVSLADNLRSHANNTLLDRSICSSRMSVSWPAQGLSRTCPNDNLTLYRSKAKAPNGVSYLDLSIFPR